MVTADNLPETILGAGTIPEKGRRKLEALDGIRGLAVLLVMLSHFDRFLPDSTIMDPFKAAIAFGWCGVDLFFVLSGFLITGILLQTRTAVNYLQSFYFRRFLRIFPIYYLTLIAVFGLVAFLPQLPNVPPTQQRWLYFVYVQNWIPLWTGVWPPNVVGHFWSLAVEEQFYLLWPACVLALAPRNLLRTAIALSLGALVLRVVFVIHGGVSEAVMLGTPTRMDSLLIGAIAALMFGKKYSISPPRNLNLIGWTTLGVAALGVVATGWHKGPLASFGFVTTIGYTLLAVGFGALVLGAALGDGRQNVVQRIFKNRALMRVGRYSYGMYVYHVPVLGLSELLLFRHLPPSLKANGLFCLSYILFLGVLSFAVAALSFELLESRVLALKRRVEPVFHIPEPALNHSPVSVTVTAETAAQA